MSDGKFIFVYWQRHARYGDPYSTLAEAIEPALVMDQDAHESGSPDGILKDGAWVLHGKALDEALKVAEAKSREARPPQTYSQCPECHGNGGVTLKDPDGEDFYYRCTACGGTGQIRDRGKA